MKWINLSKDHCIRADQIIGIRRGSSAINKPDGPYGEIGGSERQVIYWVELTIAHSEGTVNMNFKTEKRRDEIYIKLRQLSKELF